MQTTYNALPNPAFQGMLYDISLSKDIVSASYADPFFNGVGGTALGNAPFGVALVAFPSASTDLALNIGTPQVQLPNAAIATLPFYGVGVARFIDPSITEQDDFVGGGVSAEIPALTGKQGIYQGAGVDVLRKGRIWVLDEDGAAAPGKAVFYRFAAGAGLLTQLGAFSTVTDAGKNSQLVAAGARGANWFSTLSTGLAGLAVLDINLP